MTTAARLSREIVGLKVANCFVQFTLSNVWRVMVKSTFYIYLVPANYNAVESRLKRLGLSSMPTLCLCSVVNGWKSCIARSVDVWSGSILPSMIVYSIPYEKLQETCGSKLRMLIPSLLTQQLVNTRVMQREGIVLKELTEKIFMGKLIL